MTDQLWEKDDSLLPKRFIGKISNMKDFWSSVSDEDSINEKRNKFKFANRDPFAGKEYLQQNIKNKKEKYTSSLVEMKRNSLESKARSQDILKDTDTKRKIKCEKGNTKEQLSFWEGVLDEKTNENEQLTEKTFPGNTR